MVGPTREQVVAGVAGVVAAHRNNIRAVIAHGSWVRGDVWAGQSDLDLIVVGADDYVPSSLRLGFEGLRSTLGLVVEPWETSERALKSVHAQRARGGPVGECGIVQFDINGFDVVGQHDLVWGTGNDPLQGLPVPQGRDLQAMAARRVTTLVGELDQFTSELNRIACDAMKAATIFFLLRAGRQPTRDKREVPARFSEVVPTFVGRDTADAVWSLYRAADKSGDASHQAACRAFVKGLEQVVKASP